MKLLIRYSLLSFIISMLGCVKFQPSAPLYIKSEIERNPLAAQYGKVIDNHYIVKKGDTLYSIGFRFEHAYKTLAKWNGISAPYGIEIGQKIALFAPEKENSLIVVVPNVSIDDTVLGAVAMNQSAVIVELPHEQYHAVEPEPNVKKIVNHTQSPIIAKKIVPAIEVAAIKDKTLKKAPIVKAKTLIKKVAIKKEAIQKVPIVIEKKVIKKVVPIIKKSPRIKKILPVTRPVVAKFVPLKSKSLRWLWPIKGKILKNFYETNKKGIDIEGSIKQDVKAAESGIVVYSGDGLVGYGNLLIIKHNDEFLSAYGNNSQLLVKEGETIKRGQVIALIGVGVSHGIPALHFEIRKEGKPTNPTAYLK